jgi:hypothetical protein
MMNWSYHSDSLTERQTRTASLLMVRRSPTIMHFIFCKGMQIFVTVLTTCLLQARITHTVGKCRQWLEATWAGSLSLC